MDTTIDLSLVTRLAPAGHMILLRFGVGSALAGTDGLPQKWGLRYAQRGYFFVDPVIRRLSTTPGLVRWEDIAPEDDPIGIRAQAAAHGLRHGIGLSLRDEDGAGPIGVQTSIALFARADRSFADDEIDALRAELGRAHAALRPPVGVTRAEREALRMIRDGMLTKEIAASLGVTEGAIKQRLKNAKGKLDARTTAQAACLAARYGLV